MAAAQAGASLTQIHNQASAIAAATGFTNGSNGVTVTVNNPPASGANTANTSAYEVIHHAAANAFLRGLARRRSDDQRPRGGARRGLARLSYSPRPLSQQRYLNER